MDQREGFGYVGIGNNFAGVAVAQASLFGEDHIGVARVPQSRVTFSSFSIPIN
jgi:hypothetical protein